jgi:hypothetical protein
MGEDPYRLATVGGASRRHDGLTIFTKSVIGEV